ncbi:MAG: uroporphyrinogen-III C-methyltransferase [Actinomycetota bacterium]|nr:uroporphyrinogen-III C-methyltransferase [Actinomycetota bacterium]
MVFGRNSVVLVGAGPGDPGLLTVRGRQLLEEADCVVYDYLADESILGLCKPGTQLIDVGKRPDRPLLQDEINDVLVSCATRFRLTVRLKGGDPFLFGRGGEEADLLRASGISFDVVPGVTSALAVPAYAGVPVTYRGVSNKVVILTGHKIGGTHADIDFGALVSIDATIVILMGVANRAFLAEKLIEAGMDPSTPVAAIRLGSRPEQETVRTSLGELGATPLKSPATIVIGKVAELNVDFYEGRPLFGRRVAILRAAEDASQLADAVISLGARPILFEAISSDIDEDSVVALCNEIEPGGQFQTLLLTSKRSVKALMGCVNDIRSLTGVKILVVGKETSRELAKFKVTADMIGSAGAVELVQEAVATYGDALGDVLYPCSSKVSNERLELLNDELGGKLKAVVSYVVTQNMPSPDLLDQLRQADALLAFSPSQIEVFDSDFFENYGGAIVAVGATTKATLDRLGARSVVVASNPGVEAVLTALIEAL